jgi:hypothetical protein
MTSRPPKTPTFDQVQTMEFREDCFVKELSEFFTTLKKADCLNKYEIKFTVKPKQNKVTKMTTKEKRKLLKK